MNTSDKNERIAKIGVEKLLNGQSLDHKILSKALVVSRRICYGSEYELLEDIVGTALLRSMFNNKVKFVESHDSPLKRPAGNWKNTLIFWCNGKNIQLEIPSQERLVGHPDKKMMISAILGIEFTKFLKARYFVKDTDSLPRRVRHNFDKIYEMAELSVTGAIDKTFEFIMQKSEEEQKKRKS